jgi:hypothetical protein
LLAQRRMTRLYESEERTWLRARHPAGIRTRAQAALG